MNELKPCPFCGNKDVRVVFDSWRGLYSVECGVYSCPRLIVHKFKTREKAVEAWNRRIKMSDLILWAILSAVFLSNL